MMGGGGGGGGGCGVWQIGYICIGYKGGWNGGKALCYTGVQGA